MFMRRLSLAAIVAVFCTEAVRGEVLYRETFPATPGARGQNVLDQGWDVIRPASGGEGLVNILAGVAPDNVTPIGQNSAAIFGNADTVPNGDDVNASGGVNNNPFLPAQTDPPYGDGILFASRGFFPFLFSTEEVPAGTQASDVNYVRWRGRNNAPNSNPGSQSIHAALQVGGTWYVSETGLVDPNPSVFNIGQIDISGGNWGELTISSVDLGVPGGPVETPTSITLGEFNLAKPVGAVEAWGVVNQLLTANTRFDYIEFGTDIVQTQIPEPSSFVLLALAGAAWAARGRCRAKTMV